MEFVHRESGKIITAGKRDSIFLSSCLTAAMRISPFDKRFLRLGLLAVIAAVSYWMCSLRVETAERIGPKADRPQMFVLQVGIGKYVNAPVWAELRGNESAHEIARELRE